MAWTNYHSHSRHCDGTHAIESYIQEAIEANIASYGISSHAALPFYSKWAMKEDDLPSYLAEIQRLKLKYQGAIELYSSLEIDYIPGLAGPDQEKYYQARLDYTLGAVHFVEQFADGTHWAIDGSPTEFLEGLNKIFNGDIRKAVTRYYELVRWMVMLETPDIIAHLDKIKMHNRDNFYFSENEEWYRQEVEKTLKVIASLGATVEVNTRGLYKGKTLDLYPSRWILDRMRAMQIPITLNSDAHSPREVAAGFEIAARILRDVGYTHLMVLHKGNWLEAPFTETGILWPGKERLPSEITVA